MTIQEAHQNDAVNIAPHLHAVIHEDDKIRMLKITVNPGETATMHWHPRSTTYVLTPGKLHFDKPDGTSSEIDMSEGQVTSSEVAVLHAVRNVGETVFTAIQIELKD